MSDLLKQPKALLLGVASAFVAGVASFFVWKKTQRQEETVNDEGDPNIKIMGKDSPFHIEKQLRNAAPGRTDVELPPKIDLLLLIANNAEARRQFVENIKTRGYTVIRMDPETVQRYNALKNISKQYFEQPQEIKNNNADVDRNNLGYVVVPGVREYLKLRPNDIEAYWPNQFPEFRGIFDAFFERCYNTAWACFDSIAHHEEKDTRLIPADTVAAIQEFVPVKSSVSVIHYLAQEDDKCACEEHTDTGLVTLLLRTAVPSLEIWDALNKCYVKAEALCGEDEMLAFIGEKVPMFTNSKKFPATLHRVMMPSGTDRTSVAFLLDVAK
jgi:isopenicillin N synthase-like dioxygenase